MTTSLSTGIIEKIQTLSAEVEQLRAALSHCAAQAGPESCADVLATASEAIMSAIADRDRLAKWEALIASAGQFCGHCRTPFPLDEMPAHIRACPSNPMVADLAACDTSIAELRELLSDSGAAIGSLVEEVHAAYGESDGWRGLLDRIDAALGGKEQG